MKKFIITLVCLMVATMCAFAQSDEMYFHGSKKQDALPASTFNQEKMKDNGWYALSTDADELLETEEYTSFVFSNGSCSIVIWDNDDKRFKIISDKGVFDSKETRWNFGYKSIIIGLVGFYDKSDKLIKKKNGYFDCKKGFTKAVSMKDELGHNIGKDVISFLQKEQGYVRIVVPLFSGGKFDIKAPCFNN